VIVAKIYYIYKTLLKELYRNAPPTNAEGDETISSSEDEAIPSSEDEVIPSSKDEAIPSSEDETATDDAHDDVESVANISMLSI
jgi:hypothetical protein